MKVVFLLTTLLMPLSAFADLYQCMVGGKSEFRKKPCGSNSGKMSTSLHPVRLSEDYTEWKFVRHNDDMTDKVVCVAVSPQFDFLDAENTNIYHASLFVSFALVTPYVFIHSKGDMYGNSTGFHPDISGLGIKLGEGPFLPVEESAGSNLLRFSSTSSATILRLLRDGQLLRLRVRFWPYEKTHDSMPTSHTGFDAVFEQVKVCMGSPRKAQ